MQARFYLPMWGRFASPDPGRDQHFEETQSWNIYSYVQNQPTMMIDPNGEAGLLSWARDKFEQARSQVVAGVQNTAAFSRGLTDAYVNAVGLGIPSAFGGRSDGSAAYASGRAVGDGLAVFQGAMEIEAGKGVQGLAVVAGPQGGGALAVAGVLVVHGVGTVTVAAIDGSANASQMKGTEPTLPPKTVASGDGVKIDHYTKSGDHGPAHLHVKGGGPETKIGQNGKPIKGSEH